MSYAHRNAVRNSLCNVMSCVMHYVMCHFPRNDGVTQCVTLHNASNFTKSLGDSKMMHYVMHYVTCVMIRTTFFKTHPAFPCTEQSAVCMWLCFARCLSFPGCDGYVSLALPVSQLSCPAMCVLSVHLSILSVHLSAASVASLLRVL